MSVTFSGFAQLGLVVTRNAAPDGMYGSSSLRFDVGSGSIWMGDDIRDVDSSTVFTVQLSGESEHTNLAQAFRAAADELESS